MNNEGFEPGRDPRYPYHSVHPYASNQGADSDRLGPPPGATSTSSDSTLVAVLVSILGTLLVVTLVGGLAWWMLQDRAVAAAPDRDTENFELHDIEVPGREGTLEAQGGEQPVANAASTKPAAIAQSDDHGLTGQDAPAAERPVADTGAVAGAITAVNVSGGTKTISTLPCDGRNVLITASILDNTPDPEGQIASAMAMSPESMFLAPGACPSLRGFYQGGNVYPVLIDYGFDVDAVCAAARRGGGNARILSDRNEYLSPC